MANELRVNKGGSPRINLLNQQMDQIQSDTVIVGIDIAKHKHIARVVDDRGKELAKPLAFANTQHQQLLYG